MLRTPEVRTAARQRRRHTSIDVCPLCSPRAFSECRENTHSLIDTTYNKLRFTQPLIAYPLAILLSTDL